MAIKPVSTSKAHRIPERMIGCSLPQNRGNKAVGVDKLHVIRIIGKFCPEIQEDLLRDPVHRVGSRPLSRGFGALGLGPSKCAGSRRNA